MAPNFHRANYGANTAMANSHGNGHDITINQFFSRLHINALISSARAFWPQRWRLLLCSDRNTIIIKFHYTRDNFQVCLLTIIAHCPHALVVILLAVWTTNTKVFVGHQLTCIGASFIASPL